MREHAAGGGTLVVGTHGMVLTAWLVHARRRIAPDEAGASWQRLAFPVLVRID